MLRCQKSRPPTQKNRKTQSLDYWSTVRSKYHLQQYSPPRKGYKFRSFIGSGAAKQTVKIQSQVGMDACGCIELYSRSKRCRIMLPRSRLCIHPLPAMRTQYWLVDHERAGRRMLERSNKKRNVACTARTSLMSFRLNGLSGVLSKGSSISLNNVSRSAAVKHS